MGSTLVELCAGSAAVSLAWLSAGATSPIGYQGSKRAYRHAILGALGLAAGGGRERGHVVLVEPGPWGKAWQLWCSAAGRRSTCDRLRAWSAEDPRVLWERLRSAPAPTEPEDWVATWAALQHWNFRGRPVGTDGERWVTHGLHPDIDAAAYGTSYVAPDGRTWKRTDRRLPQLLANLAALPDLPGIDVRVCSGIDVEPIPGAVVYIDPDYQGTTGYGHTLPRAQVLQVAQRWREAGCLVAVSEAEPLPLDGWEHHRLPAPRGRGRTFSAQQREWLTLSRPAMGQLSLLAASP